MKIVSVKQMRELDRQAIDSGISGEHLMELAGRGASHEIASWLHDLGRTGRRRVSLLAGKGNNGGDAYVAARYLAAETNLQTTVYSVCSPEELDGDARINAERLPAGIPLIVCPEKLPESSLADDTLVVDGLLGTGLGGDLREPYKTIIGQVNRSRCPVAALDIPSGLDGDSGRPTGELAVEADLTIAMGLPKSGLFSPVGRIFCGVLRTVDIGLPEALAASAAATGEADFASDIAALLGRRPPDSHKNTFGRVLVVAGSGRYIGAPALTARAALRGGAGLVTAAIPRGLWVKTPAPALPAALIVHPVAGGEEACRFNRSSIPELAELADRAEAVAFGPGVGVEPGTGDVLQALLEHSRVAVIDADGLNLIAAAPEHFATALDGHLLTPHPGEMARLLKAFNLTAQGGDDRKQQALVLARATGATVVLKGMNTITARPDGRHWLNSSGNSALASAGTGDVLTGLIASLLAQGHKPAEAARIAVFIHGLAAETAGRSQRGLIADDLPEAIDEALRRISPFA